MVECTLFTAFQTSLEVMYRIEDAGASVADSTGIPNFVAGMKVNLGLTLVDGIRRELNHAISFKSGKGTFQIH